MNPAKKDIRDLYGRPVFVSDPDLTITDQIYEILCEEIRGGHWQIGERLPSVAALSAQTGLGRTPIQLAFDRLAEVGYVRQEQRSGTFLEAQFAEKEKNLDILGVALHLAEEGELHVTDAYSHFRLARLLRAVSDRGYAAEVRYLHTREEWSQVDTPGAIFGSDVRGVVTLHPFDHESRSVVPPNKLPFVYLGSNSRRCQPVVAGDTSKGFYEATKHLIALGHRNIGFFMDASETREENAVRIEACESAMAEAGLPFPRKATVDSFQVPVNDLFAMRQWMEICAEATAILCMRGPETMNLINVARLGGRRIPEDLSIIGHGERLEPAASVDYDYDALMSACLDLLAEQMRTRRVNVSRILIQPHLHEGSTLGPCPQCPKFRAGHEACAEPDLVSTPL